MYKREVCEKIGKDGEYMAKAKKILISAVLVFVIIAVTAVTVAILLKMGYGMSSLEKDFKTDLSTDELVDSIISELNYTDISQVSSSNISKYYDINDDLISDATVYISNKSDSCFEISCFKLKENSVYPQVESAIKNHLSSRNANFQDLDPQESKKLSECKIEYCTPYVLVVVADNSSSAVASFRNFVTGKSETVEG